MDEVRYPARVEPGANFSVSLIVRNLGSAPMYYNWPVEVSLLDPKTRTPVWRENFKSLDIRTWLPGEFSDLGKGQPIGDKAHASFKWDTGRDYDIPAKTNHVTGNFELPKKLPVGEYILALAILDPAGNLPAVRFATANYFRGGRHPIGKLGVGVDVATAQLDNTTFDDLLTDKSLHYVAPVTPSGKLSP